MTRQIGTRLLIANTVASYVRLVLSAGLALLSSRWILSALGETDFGLYAVVAGIMAFLSFLTGALASSAQRHFAYSIGQGDAKAVGGWFNASLLLHIVLALLMLLVGVPFGLAMLNGVLSIPADRASACHIVFACTLVSVVTQVVTAPFAGMLTAKQRIIELSIYQLAQTLLTFLFAYSLVYIPSDRLLAYALGVMLIAVAVSCAQSVRCLAGFHECRLHVATWISEWWRVRELIYFAGWTVFGTAGYIANTQIMAFLINMFCGPRVNASYGIASQVSGQVASISQGLFNAMAPEITSSEGSGDRDRMIALALRMSKWSVLLVCFLLLPVLCETETVLAVWLAEVPSFAPSLCRVVLLAFLVDQITVGYMVAVSAHGRIAGYQITVGSTLIAGPLIAWAVFASGGGVVWAIGAGILAVRSLCSFERVLWVKRLLGVPVRRWLCSVLARCAAAIVLPAGAVLYIHTLMEASVGRLGLSFGASSAVLLFTCAFIGMDRSERSYVLGAAGKVVTLLKRA